MQGSLWAWQRARQIRLWGTAWHLSSCSPASAALPGLAQSCSSPSPSCSCCEAWRQTRPRQLRSSRSPGFGRGSQPRQWMKRGLTVSRRW
ncbi:unnamed protein product [Symbiodinium necroappetens]|uniref:Secreted protein n=1 Tax=Symbiodinium necroappetens TaxID=1628268 RepID=A0A813CR63_9DINO|nr:unnamed protein product [Symbiodinium necroappetens]